jgi:hypothetical protein
MKRNIEELYEQIKNIIHTKVDLNTFNNKFTRIDKDISHFKFSVEDNN